MRGEVSWNLLGLTESTSCEEAGTSPTGMRMFLAFFFFQAEDGIRDLTVTGVQTCALPILHLLYEVTGCPWSVRPASPSPRPPPSWPLNRSGRRPRGRPARPSLCPPLQPRRVPLRSEIEP